MIKYLLMAFMLSGCTLDDAYETAKDINDDTFISAVARFCGPTASLAANRHLSDAEIVMRYEFCSSYRARKLGN
jgi:hypothetical protein